MVNEIRVALVGAWNCASSLVQWVEYYKNNPNDHVWLMNRKLGHYDVGDIHFICAFDINTTKVWKDISEWIFAQPNCAIFISKVPNLDAPIYRWPTLDGNDWKLKDVVKESSDNVVNISEILIKNKIDVVVNYLPTWSDKAARFYAGEALKASCWFINCMPTKIATDEALAHNFKKNWIPLIWDDVKSQVWATILHRVLAKLCEDRWLKITSTSQVNIGWNTDFLNFIERSVSKEISKKAALSAIVGNWPKIHAWLHYNPILWDQKWAYIYIEWEWFGWVKTTIETKLVVEDSPNSAGILVDAIRCIKIAQDNKIWGILTWPSSYLMKNPPVQFNDETALEKIKLFITNPCNGSD